MLRRNVRLRKEYLYRKSLEGKERDMYEKKLRIKKALAEGKKVPTELRNEFHDIEKALKYDDGRSAPQTSMDDEYANAGVHDPKIFITTSKEPSQRLVQFAKELALIIPNSQRKNRGNAPVLDLVEACRANEVSDMIFVHETRGEPDALIISHMPFGPTAYFGLHGVVLRHDIGQVAPVSLQFPHLIFNNFGTKLGERVQNILKYVFPPAKDDGTRVVSFSNDNDFISFRHHSFKQSGKDVKLQEVGPRFEMRLFKIRLGTIESKDAENEWVLRPYMNTARKTTALG
eukprot:TRINITY_DN3006_c0_g1_i1.p1 TRINITY_DN3006_c0_g1~~TRINITY_DN3006_c0_g1_i1.p1  ORF type:complete len:287 (+),score=46.56 TRINITY_DN3006_c0_g1_i1:64-924(+)